MEKIIMKFVAFVLLVITFAIGGYRIWFQSSEPIHNTIVKSFLNKSKEKDYEGTEKYVANVPSTFSQALSKSLKELSDQSVEQSEKYTIIPKSSQENGATKSKNNFSSKEIVTQLIVFIDENRNFSEIVSSKELENEARVIVAMKQDGLKDTLHSYLLTKEAGEWKIFDISPYDESSFDLDKYWAEKRN